MRSSIIPSNDDHRSLYTFYGQRARLKNKSNNNKPDAMKINFMFFR